MRIALVQLCSFGDCLYATLVACQIKRDYPDSHLTWVIGDKYASILAGNPNVDATHVIEIDSVADALSTGWEIACSWVKAELKSGSLDQAFFTQIIPDNIALYDGLIRSTIYRGYPRLIQGPHRPEVYISADEWSRAVHFCDEHQITQFKHVLLFECGPQSGQSGMNVVRAEAIAHKLASQHENVAFILSSGAALSRRTRQVIDASMLAYRDNAALSHYCTGLVGCSSGITWLATSSQAKLLPMLQILSGDCEASVRRDFVRFGLDPSTVIEMSDPDDASIIHCINQWMTHSHQHAFAGFNECVKLQKATVRKWYLWIRSTKGLAAAFTTLCRVVWLNGLGAMPWSIVGGEIQSMCGSARFRFGAFRKRVQRYLGIGGDS